MSELKKILIIRLSSIGDILLTTPFIRQARKAYPDSQIDFVIKVEYSDLLKNNPNINNLIKFDTNKGMRGLKDLKQSLLEKKYDIVFDLHNNMRSNYLRLGLQSKYKYRIKKNKLAQFLFVKFKINRYPEITPIAERYLNVGIPAGIKDDEKGLEFFFDKNSEESINTILEHYEIKQNDVFYTIAPGAGFYTKRWSIENFKIFVKNILENHNSKIVVLGNTEDKHQGEVLAEYDNVIDLTGKLTLMQSAILLSKSKVLVSNDTGLMHMATAVKVPVLGIFGSTVKEFGFFPYRSKARIVEIRDLKCRPCSHIGRNNCPKVHFKCMNDISSDMVVENFEKLLIN